MNARFLPDRPPSIQFSFRTKEEEAEDLKLFKVWLEKKHGTEFTLPEVLRYIVGTFMSEHKAFQKDKANLVAPESPAQA